MAFFPTSTGSMFEGMNPFGARPSDALTGILTDKDKEKLKNQALLSGILGTGLTYLAQPKNQGIGIPAILAKSYLGGMTQSQSSYDTALKNKIDALTITKNTKDIEMSGMTDIQKLLRAKNALDTTSPTYTTDKQYIDAALNKATSEDSSFIKNYEYAKSKGYTGTPEDWQKLTIVTQQEYNDPFKKAEAERERQKNQYKFGTPPPPPPKFATMQDVSDTATATGKTTQQVINDLKTKGITVRTK